MLEKVAWAVRTLKQNIFLNARNLMEIFKFYFILFLKLSFFYETPWVTILKTALTEVDNVLFSANPCEWMGSFSALRSKGSSSWCQELYFWHPTLLCVCHRKQLFPCLAIPWRVQVMQQCSVLLIFAYWQHFKWLKERGEGNSPLIYFLINPPNVQ